MDYTHASPHRFMVCYMSHWALNKEQKEGSGGLLVAQGSAQPAHSKDGSVLNAVPPLA